MHDLAEGLPLLGPHGPAHAADPRRAAAAADRHAGVAAALASSGAGASRSRGSSRVRSSRSSLFNIVIAVSHIPHVVTLCGDDRSRSTSRRTRCSFGTAFVMWSPVLNPLIELPKLTYPARMFYLFLQSLVPTVPRPS